MVPNSETPEDPYGDAENPADSLEALIRGIPHPPEKPSEACRAMIEQARAGFERFDHPIGPDPLGSTIRGIEIPSTADALHGTQIGDYQLEDYLGGGGMGVVYRAQQVSLNRPVALKLIRSGDLASREEILRFSREARSGARLEHPNIVPVYDAGEFEGRPFFTMAFVEGRTLKEELQSGPMNPVRAARIVRTLASAVAHAHAERIVHRDLKPANVIIGKDGEPRILDFGLAKLLDAADDGQTVGIVGTPSYMSYEQAWKHPSDVDERTDVYGLGAILYHLVCGRPPFLAATPQETIRQIRENEPPTPRSINPSVDPDLQKLCLRCLRRDMNERYQTASDLAEDLHRYLNNEPVSGVGSFSVLKTVIRRNWSSRDLVSTRHNALFGAILMTLPHLLVFGLIQFHVADWTMLSAVLMTTWVLHAVTVILVYAPSYWSLEVVERVSGFLWLSVVVSHILLFALLSIWRPQTEMVLLQEWYPLAALLVGSLMLGFAAFDGRIIGHSLAWFAAVFLMNWWPAAAPLLYAGLAGPPLIRTWFELQRTE